MNKFIPGVAASTWGPSAKGFSACGAWATGGGTGKFEGGADGGDRHVWEWFAQ